MWLESVTFWIVTTNQLHPISRFFLSIALTIFPARISRVRLSLQYLCSQQYHISSTEARIEVAMLPIARPSITKGASYSLRTLPSHSLRCFYASPNIHLRRRNVLTSSPLFRTSAFSTTASMPNRNIEDRLRKAFYELSDKLKLRNTIDSVGSEAVDNYIRRFVRVLRAIRRPLRYLLISGLLYSTYNLVRDVINWIILLADG
jgi:hypothetical protein